jgi:hypothetical protein
MSLGYAQAAPLMKLTEADKAGPELPEVWHVMKQPSIDVAIVMHRHCNLFWYQTV